MSLGQILRSLRRMQRTPEPGTDADLLASFASRRDEQAFAALVERHGPMVRNVCRRVLGDVHTAEDACQATFLVLARKAASLRQPGALVGWLYGVALRVARKARSARPPGAEASADVREPLDPHPDPLAELSARDLLDALETEVAHLPEAYRLPVVLCCLEGLSQEEAARRLGWSAGSVKGRLERGRKRLQERLTRRGLELTAALGAASVARAPLSAALAGALPQAAARFVAGTAGGIIPPQVLALSEGVLRAMTVTKIKIGVFTLIVAGMVGAAGTGLALWGQTAPQGPAQPAGKRSEAPTKVNPKEASAADKADAAPRLPEQMQFLVNRLAVPLPLDRPIEAPLRELCEHLANISSPPESNKDPSKRVGLLVDKVAFRKARGEAFDADEEIVQLPKLPRLSLEVALQKIAERIDGVVVVRPTHIEITTAEKVLGRALRVNESRTFIHYAARDQALDAVLRALETRYALTVAVAAPARDKAKETVTANLINLPFETAVATLAEVGGLKVVRKDNALLVTTPEHAQELLAANKAEPIGGWEAVPTKGDSPKSKP